MISGWNVGGHDSQYPNYTPDPRLGTWEDLAAGVQACHAMGVRVLFFVNIQPVDLATDWYRQELHRYRCRNYWGQTGSGGFGMGTLGARMGLTCRPLANCNPAFPEFRRLLVEQMRRLVEIGADGLHIDKLGSGWFDFNPDVAGGPDEAYCRGLLQCLEEIFAAGRALNPEFCLSVESYWDRTLPYAEAWWNWHDRLDHVAVLKYTFPEYLPTFAAVQPWDYNNVNNAIRYGYQLLVGPVRYSRSMQDEQSRELSRYIAEVIRLREELKETIFLGEFLDTLEGCVQAGENVRYNTHRHPRTGQRACVLVNLGETPADATVAFAGNPEGQARLYQPFQPVAGKPLPVRVTLPGERLAIVVEEG
jgi:hypothetical protein